jgi:predicted nucleic acid-binding protein
MLTIDASVWVNADSPGEPESAASRAFLDRIAVAGTAVFVPTLLPVEVAAAISRTRKDSALAREYASKLSALPFVRWISLNPDLAARSSSLAADHGLRGADAVYAAVAIASGCELISLDREHLTRLGKALRVRTPAQIIAGP